MSEVALHPSIAASHPKQGLCQVDRLRHFGVSQAHIDAVVEIARHIRDEAGQMLDTRFDEAASGAPQEVIVDAVCCTPTASGQSCC